MILCTLAACRLAPAFVFLTPDTATSAGVIAPHPHTSVILRNITIQDVNIHNIVSSNAFKLIYTPGKTLNRCG